VPFPAQCQSLQDSLAAVEDEIASLQEELQTAPPGRKGALAMQIRKLTAQANTLKASLNQCIAQNSPPPPPPFPNFGEIWDGRPFWIGKFLGGAASCVLMYSPGDDNWWLGALGSGQFISWSLAGNTAGFGHAINDGRPYWIGDFTGNGSADILMYSPGDDNWFLGQFDANAKLNWSFATNTAGFGHSINDGRPFWIGDFTGNGHADILMYYPGDGNWWLGQFDATNTLKWSLTGSTPE
jgi:hypothetical protein